MALNEVPDVRSTTDRTATPARAESKDSMTRAGAGRRLPRPTDAARVMSKLALVFVIIALIALFSALSPDTFPRYSNFTAIASANAPLLLLGLAVTTTLRVGDFDLSVSAIMIVSATVSGLMVGKSHHSAGLAIVCALLIALAIGLVNGCLVVLAGLDSFVTTLGTMTLATGLAYAFSGSAVVYGYGGDLLSLARKHVFGLQLEVLIGWAIALLLWLVFEWTVVGRQWLFSGGNREAALLLGLPVKRLRMGAYLVGSLLSGLAGVLLAGSIGSVDPSSGGEYLLTPFAAAFLGTAAIALGRFNVVGTLIGLYTLGVGVSGLQLLGAPPWISNIFSGGTLVVALAFAAVLQRRGPGLRRLRLPRFAGRSARPSQHSSRPPGGQP